MVMTYAEIDKSGNVVGIGSAKVLPAGTVSCGGLTDWQISQQGYLHWTGVAWDTTRVPIQTVPVVVVPTKSDHIEAIKEILVAINVPPDQADAISVHLAAITA